MRRRRMTRAAFDLQSSGDKVIDVALRYGYDSPTAFNRAFQGVHGVAPSAARQEGVRLVAYHPISFKLTIRGDVEMNYRIEKKDAFRIVGPKLSCPWTPEREEGFTEVPKFWAEQGRQGAIQTMQKRIMTEWLPSSGYQYADAPAIEQYLEGDQSSEDYVCYIWVPVQK